LARGSGHGERHISLLATARQVLTAEGGIPPGKESHAGCLACVSVGLQSSTQELLATVEGTKVIGAGLKVALGVDHGVALLERAGPGSQHATELVRLVELLFFCTAGWGGVGDTAGGVVVWDLPALPQRIGVCGLLPIGHHVIVLWPAVEVPAHATGQVEVGGGHLHLHRVVSVRRTLGG